MAIKVSDRLLSFSSTVMIFHITSHSSLGPFPTNTLFHACGTRQYQLPEFNRLGQLGGVASSRPIYMNSNLRNTHENIQLDNPPTHKKHLKIHKGPVTSYNTWQGYKIRAVRDDRSLVHLELRPSLGQVLNENKVGLPLQISIHSLLSKIYLFIYL